MPTILTICQSATDVFTLPSQRKPHASRIFRGHSRSKSQSSGLWRKGSYHKIAANTKLCLVCQHRDPDWRALELGSKDANRLSLQPSERQKEETLEYFTNSSVQAFESWHTELVTRIYFRSTQTTSKMAMLSRCLVSSSW